MGGGKEKLAMINWDKNTTDIVLLSPWLGRLLLALPMTATEAIPTFATDNKQILYNPAFAESLSEAEQCGCRVHECLHMLLGHAFRRGSREHGRWNAAADYELNGYLVEAGWTLPAGALVNPTWNGKTAEEIYELLSVSQSKCLHCDGAHADGSDDSSPAGTARMAAAKAEWEKTIAAIKWGNLPAGIDRAISGLLAPKHTLADALLPWLMVRPSGDEETWCPPSRRYSLLPSGEQETLSVAVCVDTSGSVSEDLLREFMVLLLGCDGICSVAVIIFADVDVSSVFEEPDNASAILAAFAAAKGGGGTCFDVALAKAVEYAPDLIVYLTDGEGPPPLVKPECPIVWSHKLEGELQ